MPLAADEVRVWQASLTDSPGSAAQLGFLSPAEVARADRFRHPRRRSAFLVARTMVRSVVAHELGADPRALRFAIGPHGKPSLEPPNAVHFNLSHSGDVILVAVAGHEVGVDVERIKPTIDHASIARRFFSSLENRQLASLPPPLRSAAFFAAWTRKEALVKAWGVGLSLPFDCFDVSVFPDRPAQFLRAREGPGRLGRWSVHELEPGPGYAAAVAVAVAVEGPLAPLTCRRWDQDGPAPAPRRAGAEGTG